MIPSYSIVTLLFRFVFMMNVYNWTGNVSASGILVQGVQVPPYGLPSFDPNPLWFVGFEELLPKQFLFIHFGIYRRVFVVILVLFSSNLIHISIKIYFIVFVFVLSYGTIQGYKYHHSR